MQLCSRCHKRMPVVFVSKLENNKLVNEGLCIKCARELGIGQVDKIIEQMGLSEEDVERMNAEVDPESAEVAESDPTDDGLDEGKAPPIDFTKLFGGAMMGEMPPVRRDDAEAGAGAASDTSRPGKKNTKRKYLSQFCLDLTKKAKDGGLDEVIGRDRELARVMQILCRRQKNNPCLIGEPGVGKTAIAEALASHIASGNVPFKLRGCEVFMLDMTALVAGTQFRGQFETRVKGLIEEVKALGNIILVIDEVHTIASAGDAEGSMNAANILKPALSRGEIRVIGATTLAEYRKYIEKDSALERRFQPVLIDEPSEHDTVEIIRGIKKYYESFHGITIPDETVKRAVSLSERYITDRFLPDKAIDLIDEASSYLALNSKVISEIDEKQAELDKLAKEREAVSAGDSSDEEALDEKYHKLADIKVSELNVSNELGELKEKRKDVVLTTADLARVIEIWTGIPASNITENEFKKIDGLESKIKSQIIGQDEAVTAVTRAIKRNRAGVSYTRKPVSFIFAGPTGVGKTEFVKVLAKELFDSPETLIRLDMSEFMEKHSVSKIIGAPPGYVGYDEAGQLTEKIRRKPYSVILFDEIEKAHPDVLNILLQILDDGILTDAQGRRVNFENTVIIMTTNAGSNTSSNIAGFDSKVSSEQNSDRTMKALSSFLRPEFINRVDEIVTFNSLDKKDFTAIAKLMLGKLEKVMSEKGISLVYGDDVCEFIAEKSFSTKFGARNMRRFISREVEDEIANAMIVNYEKTPKKITVGVADDKISIKCDYDD